MSRALLLQRTIVPKRDRAAFMKRLREKRDYYEQRDCRFRVFEEVQLHGAFLEFIESEDGESLDRAQAGAPDPMRDAQRVYNEVELS